MTSTVVSFSQEGPARSMHVYVPSDTFNVDEVVSVSFYCTVAGNCSFFDAAGNIDTVPVAAFQTIICVCRGVRVTGHTAGTVVGYIV